MSHGTHLEKAADIERARAAAKKWEGHWPCLWISQDPKLEPGN
jgi:hypothetical protein